MNLLDLFLLLALALLVVLALRSLWRSRRRGGCSCSGNCAACQQACQRKSPPENR